MHLSHQIATKLPNKGIAMSVIGFQFFQDSESALLSVFFLSKEHLHLEK